jgi:hypothetical protein
VLLRLDETILRETPPLDCCDGRLGAQVRVPSTGNHAQRILHGAINVGTGDVAWLSTEGGTKETHQGFLSMVRSPGRGWDLVLFEDHASPHTAPDSRAWASHLGIEIRLLPQATPELNAMDPLWRQTTKEGVGDRETITIERSALDACQYIIDLSPRDRLRKAGVRSGNFWLTPERACQRTSGHPEYPRSAVRRGRKTSRNGGRP